MRLPISDKVYNESPLISNKEIIISCLLAVGASISTVISMAWGLAALGYGLWKTIRNGNENDEAIIWSAYLAGLEVVLRGTHGSVFWEFGKYSVVLLLIVGLLSDGSLTSRRLPTWIFVVFILSIPACVTTFSWSNRISEDISFNISGLLCLLVSSYYFSVRPISYRNLKKAISFFILPVISLLIVILYKSPTIRSIHFKTQASAAASGGFGANQTATILGAGWLMIVVLLINKNRVTSSICLTLSILVLIFFRSFLTFSRGGNVAAFLAFIAFYLTFIKNKAVLISIKSIRNIAIIAGAVFVLGYVVNNVTGGMFENRLMGKNSMGEQKVDMTSGRTALLEEEYALFKMYPLGVGVGGSSYFREKYYNNSLASHNEFGRLLSEHGVFGIIIGLSLIIMPLRHYRSELDVKTKAFCALFFVVSIMTAMHSAFRLAMPAFFYGMSFLSITYEDEDTVLIENYEDD